MAGAMKCPSCRGALTLPEERCPHCKLSLQKLDVKFGLVPRHSRYLTDRTETLSVTEMEQLRNQLRLFKLKFAVSLFNLRRRFA